MQTFYIKTLDKNFTESEITAMTLDRFKDLFILNNANKRLLIKLNKYLNSSSISGINNTKLSFVNYKLKVI